MIIKNVSSILLLLVAISAYAETPNCGAPVHRITNEQDICEMLDVKRGDWNKQYIALFNSAQSTVYPYYSDYESCQKTKKCEWEEGDVYFFRQSSYPL